jgi:hypothetical protein
MKLGIRFNDNDFGLVITKYLSLFKDTNTLGNVTKEHIVEHFNKIVPSINRLIYNDSTTPDDYLEINVDNVYIGDEVNDFLKSDCVEATWYWYNGEFHYIDLETGDITTV